MSQKTCLRETLYSLVGWGIGEDDIAGAILRVPCWPWGFFYLRAVRIRYRRRFAAGCIGALWYVLLPGPSGAILYRLAYFLSRRWGGQGNFGRFAVKAFALLEWPAVRLTAVSFAIVGDFEDAVYCWRTQASAWKDKAAGIVLASGAGALGVRLGMPLQEIEGVEPRPELGLGESAEAPFLDSAVGLLWRALVVWIFVLIVLSAASAF